MELVEGAAGVERIAVAAVCDRRPESAASLWLGILADSGAGVRRDTHPFAVLPGPDIGESSDIDERLALKFSTGSKLPGHDGRVAIDLKLSILNRERAKWHRITPSGRFFSSLLAQPGRRFQRRNVCIGRFWSQRNDHCGPCATG